MKRTRSPKPDLAEEIKTHAKAKPKKETNKEYEGNTEIMISSGSTLLNLAISGGRKRGGGFPGGIMVVAYGPSGSGKTVLACEVAGDIQRQGGAINYKDSEARLDKKFSEVFDLVYDEISYEKPNTVSEAFLPLYKWKVDTANVNGYIIDSLAALSTDMEMDNDDGDKMGMRRAKEFSEHLRKGARIVTNNNLLLFCTNQIREKADAQKYERKDINPGGKAIEFYASLILRFSSYSKITKEVKVAGKPVKRVVGIEVDVEVVKSSIWKPHHVAPVIIYYNYGIDDIRANLQYIKDYSSNTVYTVNDEPLNISLDKSVVMVESMGKENELREQVIDLWEEIEAKFEMTRKKKQR